MTTRTPTRPQHRSGRPATTIPDAPTHAQEETTADSSGSDFTNVDGNERVLSTIRGILGPAATTSRRSPTAPPSFSYHTPIHHPTPHRPPSDHDSPIRQLFPMRDAF